MQEGNRRDRFNTYITLTAASVVCAVILYSSIRPVIHAIHHEFFIENDSVEFFSLGQNLVHAKGFRDFDGGWMSDWPPLYPLALGFFGFWVKDPIVNFGVVSSVCFFWTLVVTWIMLRRMTSSPLIQMSAISAVAFCPTIVQLFHSGYSEALYIPLALTAIELTDRYCESKRHAFFLLAAVGGAACFMTRYIGSALLLAGLLSLATARGAPFRVKLLEILVFAAVVCTPIALWCLLNFRNTGTYMGDRSPGLNTLNSCISALWVCLENAFGSDIILIFLLVLGMLGAMARLANVEPDRSFQMRTGVFFAVAYGVMLLWSTSRYDIDMVDDRLVSPMVIPLVCAVVGLFEPARALFIPAVKATVASLVAGMLLVSSILGFQRPQIPQYGYLEPEWTMSPTLQFVRAHTFTQPLFSNDCASIFFIGHKTSSWVAVESSEPTMESVESDIDQVPNGMFVIWLYNGLEPEQFDADDLARRCGLTIDRRFSDGVVFERNYDAVVTQN